MEAMSVETMLLSSWEDVGFVGKTRVPIGQSDVDALAFRARDHWVRVGEAKVREGSRKMYLVDEDTRAWMEPSQGDDFESWLDPSWRAWLDNLHKLWTDAGQSEVVPWLPHLSDVKVVEVIFLCNLAVLCDQEPIHSALQRCAALHLRKNQAVAARLDAGTLRVAAQVVQTLDVVTTLVKGAFTRLDKGYGRRFADPLRDATREIRRYLRPEPDRLQKDAAHNPLGTRKDVTVREIRKAAVRQIFEALGIDKDDVTAWLQDATQRHAAP
jgi:hypothetical protein